MRKKVYIEVMHKNTAVEVFRKDDCCLYDEGLFLYYAENHETTDYRKYNRFRRGRS